MTDVRAATDAAKAALYGEEDVLFSPLLPAPPPVSVNGVDAAKAALYAAENSLWANVGTLYNAKVLNTQPSHLLGYWPLDDISGAIARDATLQGRSGVYSHCSLNATTFLDGFPAPRLNGSNSDVNLYAAINTAFNPAEGTLAGWAQTSDFGTSVQRWLAYLSPNAGGTPSIQVFKLGANTLRFYYIAGGVTKFISLTLSDTSWFSWALTWSKSADKLIAYKNGLPVGTTQTGLGTWAGALNPLYAVLGAKNSSGANGWLDYYARPGLWNIALTPAEIASLYTISTPTHNSILDSSGQAILDSSGASILDSMYQIGAA